MHLLQFASACFFDTPSVIIICCCQMLLNSSVQTHSVPRFTACNNDLGLRAFLINQARMITQHAQGRRFTGLKIPDILVYCISSSNNFCKPCFYFFFLRSQKFRKVNDIHLRINKTFFPAKQVLYSKEHLSLLFGLGLFVLTT